MARRVGKAESFHITEFCRALVDRGLRDDRVRYLASGRYSDCFRVQTTSGTEVIAKVSTYREGCLRAIARAMWAGDYAKARRVLLADAVSISNRLAPITNLMLQRGATPHLVWAFGDFDCKNFARTALRSRLSGPVRKRLRQLSRDGGQLQALYSNISFHERFTCDLTDFIQDPRLTPDCLKCIMAQVVHTVGRLQETMPGFRHNDLSTNNVFVKLLPDAHGYDRYTLGDITFYTTIPDVLVAVADWDFAHCQEPVDYGGQETCLRNERVVSGKYQLKPRHNQTYDVHFFFTTLLGVLKGRSRTFREAIAFLKAVTGTWSDRSDVYLPRLEPDGILMHDFFKPLRARPEGRLRHAY